MASSFVYLTELPSVIEDVRIVDWDDERSGTLITTCKVDCNGCASASEVTERLARTIEYLNNYPRVLRPPYVITKSFIEKKFKVHKLHMGNGARVAIAPYRNPYTHETVCEKTTVFVTGEFLKSEI